MAQKEVTEAIYTNYQTQLQALFYNYAQEPNKMQQGVNKLNKEFNTTSPAWKTYTHQLSQNPTKAKAINQEVKTRLKEKGISYGTPRR